MGETGKAGGNPKPPNSGAAQGLTAGFSLLACLPARRGHFLITVLHVAFGCLLGSS